MTVQTQKKPACLILCLGTSEPRVEVNGKWEELKSLEQSPYPELDRASGLYEMCDIIIRCKLKIPISYPITEVAFKYACEQSKSPVDIFLICTKDPSSRKSVRLHSPLLNDTEPSGRLLQREWPERNIKIFELGKDPDSLDNASRKVEEFLNTYDMANYNEVYFCQSAGLPVVNSELTRQLARRSRPNKFSLRFFQIRRPDIALLETNLWAHDWNKLILPGPDDRMMADYLSDVIPKLLNGHAYKAAIALVEELARFKHLMPDLIKADAYWSLNLPAAGLDADHPFDQQLNRARLGWYIASALMNDKTPNVAHVVEWCGDTLALTRDLLRILALKLENFANRDEITLMADNHTVTCDGKPVHSIFSKGWTVKTGRLTKFLDSCPDLDNGKNQFGTIPQQLQVLALHKTVKHVRNDIVHRFTDEAHVRQILEKDGGNWGDKVKAALSAVDTCQLELFTLRGHEAPILKDLDILHDSIELQLSELAGGEIHAS